MLSHDPRPRNLLHCRLSLRNQNEASRLSGLGLFRFAYPKLWIQDTVYRFSPNCQKSDSGVCWASDRVSRLGKFDMLVHFYSVRTPSGLLSVQGRTFKDETRRPSKLGLSESAFGLRKQKTLGYDPRVFVPAAQPRPSRVPVVANTSSTAGCGARRAHGANDSRVLVLVAVFVFVEIETPIPIARKDLAARRLDKKPLL